MPRDEGDQDWPEQRQANLGRPRPPGYKVGTLEDHARYQANLAKLVGEKKVNAKKYELCTDLHAIQHQNGWIMPWTIRRSIDSCMALQEFVGQDPKIVKVHVLDDEDHRLLQERRLAQRDRQTGRTTKQVLAMMAFLASDDRNKAIFVCLRNHRLIVEHMVGPHRVALTRIQFLLPTSPYSFAGIDFEHTQVFIDHAVFDTKAEVSEAILYRWQNQ